jgi:hypothetical protein
MKAFGLIVIALAWPAAAEVVTASSNGFEVSRDRDDRQVAR